VIFARGGAQSCGLLRSWWDAHFPSNYHRRPWEQASIQHLYMRLYSTGPEPNAWHAPFDSRIRLMPSARYFRRADSQWASGGRRAGGTGDSWASADAPEDEYSEDDFIHHGVRRACCAALNAFKRLSHSEVNRTLEQTQTIPPVVRIRAAELSRVFDANAAGMACPKAEPWNGTPTGFDYESKKLSLARAARRRNHSTTNLDGSPSAAPRTCWRESRAKHRLTTWVCFPGSG